jgi:hypothetical protein
MVWIWKHGSFLNYKFGPDALMIHGLLRRKAFLHGEELTPTSTAQTLGTTTLPCNRGAIRKKATSWMRTRPLCLRLVLCAVKITSIRSGPQMKTVVAPFQRPCPGKLNLTRQ